MDYMLVKFIYQLVYWPVFQFRCVQIKVQKMKLSVKKLSFEDAQNCAAAVVLKCFLFGLFFYFIVSFLVFFYLGQSKLFSNFYMLIRASQELMKFIYDLV